VDELSDLQLIQSYRDRVSKAEYIGLILSRLRAGFGELQGYSAVVERDKETVNHPIKPRISNMNTIADFLRIQSNLIDFQLQLIDEIDEVSRTLE
jgi:hypothetical protein